MVQNCDQRTMQCLNEQTYRESTHALELHGNMTDCYYTRLTASIPGQHE